MKKRGHIKRLLPGGNTSVGFFSYFNYIIDDQDARKIYYIKGGSGVGKSYLMKKIGNELLDLGYDESENFIIVLLNRVHWTAL